MGHPGIRVSQQLNTEVKLGSKQLFASHQNLPMCQSRNNRLELDTEQLTGSK